MGGFFSSILLRLLLNTKNCLKMRKKLNKCTFLPAEQKMSWSKAKALCRSYRVIKKYCDFFYISLTYWKTHWQHNKMKKIQTLIKEVYYFTMFLLLARNTFSLHFFLKNYENQYEIYIFFLLKEKLFQGPFGTKIYPNVFIPHS